MHERAEGGHRWGALSLGFLAVTIVSGVALVPLYRPEEALASVEAIQAGLPWAWMVRAVHAVAALGFLLSTLIHLWDAVRRGGLDRVPPGVWWRSTLLLPIAIAGMLTGFLLRGDAEALAAMAIGRGVLESVPGIGEGLATLLLGPAGAGFGPVALHHAGTFTVLPWLLSIEHGRRVWPDARSWVTALAGSVAIAGLVPVPLGPADAAGASLLGPWYLLGLQGMLLDLPIASAWIVPIAFLLGVGGLAHVQGRRRTVVLAGLGCVAAAWVGWTVRLLVAGAG
jgi:hypothetical protein